MKIDVIVLTKNSEYVLEKCLNSIYKNIPINRLIIIDGFSTDRTLNIIQKYSKKYQNVVLVHDAGTRATARQKGIQLVNTKWFAFIDSDIILDEGWFETVKKFISNNVGAIAGKTRVPIAKIPRELLEFQESMAKLRRIIKGTSSGSTPAFTGDTLIRTSAVKDIILPPLLHWFEDSYIQSHVLGKGYRWIHLDSEICDHCSVPERYARARVALQAGACARLIGITTFKDGVLNVIKSFPKGIYTALYFKNAKAMTYSFEYFWNCLIGWLNWKKVLTKIVVERNIAVGAHSHD